MLQKRGDTRRKLAMACAVALMGTAAASLAPAATLDEQTCDQLKREVAQLEGLGARDNLNKGATWGKANLRPAQLEQVKKLIEMDETVAFRCPRPKPQPDPAAVQAKGKAGSKGQPKAQSGETGKLAKDLVKPKPKPRPKPATTTAGGTAAGAAAAAATAPPKPKPRQVPAQPKPQDAYSPPKAPPAQ